MRRRIPEAGCAALMIIVAACNREEPSQDSHENAAILPAPESAVEQSPRGAPSPNAMIGDSPENGAKEDTATDLKQLSDPQITPEVWLAVQQRILERGPAAVPALAAGLSSGKPLEREMAATLLTIIGEGLEQAQQPLRDALDDESAYVRANAATALCQLPGTDEAVIPVLAELLESPDPNLRQMAATNLGNFGPEAAPFVDRLANSLDDDRPEVLVPVVELLGRIGPPAEVTAPRLRQIAFEQTGDVQAAATAALEQIETSDPQP